MNCKPGDIAVFVQSFCPENVGRYVTVLWACPIGESIAPDGAYIYNDGLGGPAWFVESLGGPLLLTNTGRKSIFGAALDAHLRPISPPASDVETRGTQECEA